MEYLCRMEKQITPSAMSWFTKIDRLVSNWMAPTLRFPMSIRMPTVVQV